MIGLSSARLPLGIALMAGLGWLVATDEPNGTTTVAAPVRQSAPETSKPRVEKREPDASVHALLPRDELIPVRPAGTEPADLFATRSWVEPAPRPPPPAPVAVVPPPATALAPAPPQFIYLGKRRDDQGWQVYLGHGEAALIVREGETLEGGYRVESIQPPTLTLVRAGQDGQQRIAIGSWE